MGVAALLENRPRVLDIFLSHALQAPHHDWMGKSAQKWSLSQISRKENSDKLGCPGKTMESACNRPFGDGPPSDIRSFPFELNKSDIRKVKQQL